MTNFVTNLNYIFNNGATKDWEFLAKKIDSAIVEELETFAWLTADDKECTKEYLFEKNSDLSIFGDNNFLELKLNKFTNLNNKYWLKSFRIKVADFLEINDQKLNAFFDDRFVTDQFGFQVEEKTIQNYFSIPIQYRDSLYFYSMPKLDHLNTRVLEIARSRWHAYFHKSKTKTFHSKEGLKRNAVLFVMDPPTEVQLQQDKKINYVYSHTKHLLQHLQAFLNRGYVAVIQQKETEDMLVVSSVSPTLNIEKRLTVRELDELYNLVGYCSIYLTDFLNTKYTKRPEVTNILIQPAVHWIENATFFHYDFLLCLQAVATHIDIVVSQNARMIELTKSLLELGGARIPASNYLEVPICIWRVEGDRFTVRQNIRKRYGYSDEVRVIVNGGGAWSWTDTDKFIEEFLKYCVANPDTKLRFIQMGLRQKANLDHAETIICIEKLIKKYGKIAEKYVVIEDWDIATKLLPSALWAFDYGFSLSKDSVEAFQAHRVRLTEYIQHELPPIINSYDSLAQELSGCAILLSEPKKYHSLFSELESETSSQYEVRRKKIDDFIKFLNAKGDSNKIVNCLESNDPKFKVEQIEKVKVVSQDMIRRIINFGFYDIECLNFGSKTSVDLNNKVVRRNIILRILNKIIKAITPEYLHQKIYKTVTKYLYE